MDALHIAKEGSAPVPRTNTLLPIPDQQRPIGAFQGVHPNVGIAGPFFPWQQLQTRQWSLTELSRDNLRVSLMLLVSVWDSSTGTGSRLFGVLRRRGEPGVETGQELPEDLVGLTDGVDVGQVQPGCRPVLPVASIRSTLTLAKGERAMIFPVPS